MYLVQYEDDTSWGELRVTLCQDERELNQMWHYDGAAITIKDVREVSAVFKLVVAGSRGFTNYEYLRDRLDYLLQNQVKEQIVIISGKAPGADTLGERYARERGLLLEEMPADWDRYGKSAGYRRNEEMANESSAVVVFWDGKSPGTKHMIDLAKKHNKPLRVEMYGDTNHVPMTPMKPTVVVNKHHGNIPSDAVYIGRGSKWGNPFTHLDGTTAQFKVGSRDEAVSAFREWFMCDEQAHLRNSLHELKGKTLVCYCKPQTCHGDVLAELADKL